MSLTHLVRRLAAAVAVGLLCAGAVVFTVGSPAVAAPKLTVSKTSGLKDGDTVTVSGSGFTPNLKNIALGQCIKNPQTSTDCNLAGGAVFVNADSSGKTSKISLKLATTFDDHKCGTNGCVIAAQILPSAAEPAVVAANKAQVPITFTSSGGTTASPKTSTTTAAAATADEALPKTGPGLEWATMALIGSAFLLPGMGLLAMLPARRRRLATFR
ncbi:neocarzinostatin apoprotein domain-containing protein [Actinoplanes sp. NPDC051861]|uniref:neocarzinostatin apoprotein domain-containing protein n=1 Tax=Actinoplanes sp. NPDC051861 TaxID=3155170 RepID=UPI0034308C78